MIVALLSGLSCRESIVAGIGEVGANAMSLHLLSGLETLDLAGTNGGPEGLMVSEWHKMLGVAAEQKQVVGYILALSVAKPDEPCLFRCHIDNQFHSANLGTDESTVGLDSAYLQRLVERMVECSDNSDLWSACMAVMVCADTAVCSTECIAAEQASGSGVDKRLLHIEEDGRAHRKMAESGKELGRSRAAAA